MSAPAQAAVPVPWTGRLPRPTGAMVAVVTVVAALLVYIVVSLHQAAPATTSTPFPHDAAMERATGVQFTRVAVVGDGGLVMVEYVVEDVEKATAFQADRAHVPTLTTSSGASTNRVSIMKPGHLIRAGQTYYFVYQNTNGMLTSGSRVMLTYLDHQLSDVPVL